MIKYYVFFRAVNVGKRTVKMESLKQNLQALGYKDVHTFIASGNACFCSPEPNIPKLERQIFDMMKSAYGFDVEAYVRTPLQIKHLLAMQPFPKEKVESAHSWNIGFTDVNATEDVVDAILEMEDGFNHFCFIENSIHWLNQKSIHDTTISQVALEKTLGGRTTFRGRNTLVKMLAKFGD